MVTDFSRSNMAKEWWADAGAASKRANPATPSVLSFIRVLLRMSLGLSTIVQVQACLPTNRGVCHREASRPRALTARTVLQRMIFDCNLVARSHRVGTPA